MSSLVLLKKDGTVEQKLQLVFLPNDYIVPDGMMVSWKTDIHLSSTDPLDGLFGPREPQEAYFFFGNAMGQIIRNSFKMSETDDDKRMRFGVRTMTITVQGASASDVMELRGQILHLIDTRACWEVHNDLNPKPGFFKRLFRKGR